MLTCEKRIVFYSLINGVGSSTISYQLSRLFGVPMYQEQKNDLVHFLKDKLDKVKYPLRQIDDLDSEDYEESAIYDLKTPNKKIFNLATEIIVLTNNSYLDILKTIATLQQIQSIVKDVHKPIHVIFNRLQNATPKREKKYTAASKELILSNSFGLNIKFSYIRTSLIYYRGLKDGRFFMDHFYKKDKDILDKYIDVKDLGHIEYLEMFYDNRYEDVLYDFSRIDEFRDIFNDFKNSAIDYNISLVRDEKIKAKKRDITDKGISDLIVNKNFHLENIRFSQGALKDMYSLLYKLGGIYNSDLYECLECKNNRPCWKREYRKKYYKCAEIDKMKKCAKDDEFEYCLEKCLDKSKCKTHRTNIEMG